VSLFASYGLKHALVDYIPVVPGDALRISRRTLEHEISTCAELRKAITRYLFLLADQLTQISACNRLHSLEQRCCFWLLAASDSSHSDEFQFTHEFLAVLLGVQRPSVSTIANGLKKRGLIRYSHGWVKISDRAALEAATCECYRA